MPVAGQSLPDNATVILHVSKARQLPKNGTVCQKIDQDAFRCDIDGISVTWVEHFEGEGDQLQKAAMALKGDLVLKRSGVIVSAKVGDIRTVLAKVGIFAEVKTDPQPINQAHCLITGIAPDNLSALLALTLAFPPDRFIPCQQIEGLV